MISTIVANRPSYGPAPKMTTRPSSTYLQALVVMSTSPILTIFAMRLLENGIDESAVTQAYRSEVGAEWIVAVVGIELSLAMQNGDGLVRAVVGK